MFELTSQMSKDLCADLKRYHALVSGQRCSGVALEEFIVRAIKSNSGTSCKVVWRGSGHDDQPDISMSRNGRTHHIRVKSGEIKSRAGYLSLSGFRLGRFKNDWRKITSYLNTADGNLISLPYRKTKSENYITHIYQLAYVDVSVLRGLKMDHWKKRNSFYEQTSKFGVLFSVRPTMSWQVWWSIPLSLVHFGETFEVQSINLVAT